MQIKTIFSDLWGRLENDSGLTASNVAKYDGLHSMVVFKEHPPSHMNKVQNNIVHVELPSKRKSKTIFTEYSNLCRVTAGYLVRMHLHVFYLICS